MNWSLIGRTLRLAFLLRVPLFTLILLAMLGPVAYKSSMIGNLLDQEAKGSYLFLVSFSAFLLAFTAVTTINLTLVYGSARFDEAAKLGLAQKRPLLTFLLGYLAASILTIFVHLRTKPKEPMNIAFLILGMAAAFGLVLLAKVVQLALTDPKTTRHPPPFLVFPAYMIPGVEHVFDNIYCWSSGTSRGFKSAFNRLSQWSLGILRGAGQGYLVDLNPPKGQPLQLKSGHVFALSLSVLAFLSYLLIGLAKSRITESPAKVPALAFVLLFLIVACWGLSALTFFFDRYHFPLLWTLLALSMITAFVPQSDHFFRVEKTTFEEPPTAAEYMNKRLDKPRRLIFVTAPGGGIQAAAWTAEVLTELNNQAPGFRAAVAGISSVSGGSLGSIIYAASFAERIGEKQVAENARKSAIDEVAWGWTVPDYWRAVLPWFRFHAATRAIDRGWALEEKWAAINCLKPSNNKECSKESQSAKEAMLSDWAEIAKNGRMPALLINSMLVEHGAPVVFSNTHFPLASDAGKRIVNFYDLYAGQRLKYDVRVYTAARLSASFSYVAPASRPDLDGPFNEGFHFVDGGYYDNFGMTSLLAWLAEALDDPAVRSRMTDILMLEIRHFNQANEPPGPSRQGWGYQLLAPPVALYNMRNYAQDSTARKELELFGKYYAGQGVNIWKTTIAYDGGKDCNDAPLSWKLDQQQQDCIQGTWDRVGQKQSACTKAFVDGDPGTVCKKAADPGD